MRTGPPGLNLMDMWTMTAQPGVRDRTAGSAPGHWRQVGTE